MDRFSVPATRQRFELEIRRSGVITTVVPVADKHEAFKAIASIRTEFPDASHHCWAMVAASPGNVYHQDQSDDGEPKGTAGKPMLNVLLHSNLGNIVVVVTRFFGGIKLGAGGLVRAYTQSVSTALKDLDTRIQFIFRQYQIVLSYSQLDTLEHWLKTTDICVDERIFTDRVLLHLAVPESELAALKTKLTELDGKLIAIEEQLQ